MFDRDEFRGKKFLKSNVFGIKSRYYYNYFTSGYYLLSWFLGLCCAMCIGVTIKWKPCWFLKICMYTVKGKTLVHGKATKLEKKVPEGNQNNSVLGNGLTATWQ